MTNLEVNPKILFCKHHWRRCYAQFEATRARRKRKQLRKVMRETARYILELKERA